MRMGKAFILFCILVYSFSPAGLAASGKMNLNVKSAILMNADTGRILYAQNADRQIQPASLTKILSLYLINEAVGKGKVHPGDYVRISKKARKASGSRMFVEYGTSVQLEDLIKGMAVVSANDASIAAAEYIAGSEDKFVAQMNIKARELGMRHSCFKNSNGLPANGQTSTARDILKLSHEYIKRFPDALNIHAMQFYEYNHINQHNRNRFLKMYPEVDGLKTGFVCEAGYHIVVTAKKDHARLIAVVMGAATHRIRTRETKKLLDAGFRMLDNETRNTVVPSGAPLRDRNNRTSDR
ncbi:MAG: D-alanyl-D-alanine carboxypeptidase [Deltaproteobacteria bacterium]|nr:D-alanyl-D-alanine carboxypeptidase [Deltaproteobacteria bacterium]